MPRLSRGRDERGTIFVLVALAMPVLLLFAALTLDVGNWYVTKRQLQNRADKGAVAAALAYGYLYPSCSPGSGHADAAGLEQQVALEARRYAGDNSVPQALNTHPGDTATVTVNADPCTDQGASIESPGGGASTNVEVTENVPSVMGAIGSLADLYARSRVSVLQLEAATGLRPFAVADARLTECAWVDFDRGNGPTSRFPLRRDATVPNRFVGSATLSMSGASDSAYIEADVVLGDCADAGQRITYPNAGFVFAWDSGGNASPRIERVSLIDGCNDNPSFVPRHVTQCQVGVNAQVCIRNPRQPQIRADINGTTLNLPWRGGSGCRALTASGAVIRPGDGGGDGTVEAVVRVRNRNPPPPFGNGQYGQWIRSDPHRISAGNDLQIGPIRDLRLSVTDHEVPASFGQQIVLDLDPLGASSADGSLPAVLRGRSLAASERAGSGPVSCPDTSPADALRRGCERLVHVTTGAACVPASCVGGTPSGALTTAAYNALWAPNGVCTQNNWDDYHDDPASMPRGDPRLILVPVVEPGAAFSATGSGSNHPVRHFAAFYVTGWQGGACAGPDQTLPRATALSTGAIWGHFIKFVVPPSSGSPTTTACDPETATLGIRACIATVVR